MSSVKDYPTLTKVFLKKLGINKKCHPEMIVSNKLNDKYIVMCSYCMRREYIKKHLRYKMKNNNDTSASEATSKDNSMIWLDKVVL